MVRGEASRLGQFFLAQERNCLCGGESPLTIFLAQERNCLCGFTPRTARTGSHWLHTLITLLKKKNCQGRLAPLKRKKCILIISSTTTSPRASRTTKVAGTPLLPHCDYTLAVGNRSMPKDNKLSSLALLSDAYKPPIAPSIASPLSFSFPEAPRHCP